MNKYRATIIANRMEQNSCRGKREYLSMREAGDVALVVSKRIGEFLVAYQCPFCCLFHVGHRPSRARVLAERKLKKYGFRFERPTGLGANLNELLKACLTELE
jgi:hypothetical protein